MGFTVANLLTIARMVLVPVFIMLVVSNHPGWALGVFAAAGISDALDGFVARRFGQGSSLGAFLDPLA
ncbi:MAG: CDP-alcohol phosphatidyltransferase family protein, partial [Acidobacteria bacterium]|nr:CDP-alcohol phosphatidyltransferase family protein [Acidobacteriota bacterium]